MQLYCGIDLHSNKSVTSMIDDIDRLISEQGLNNDLLTITAPFIFTGELIYST